MSPYPDPDPYKWINTNTDLCISPTLPPLYKFKRHVDHAINLALTYVLCACVCAVRMCMRCALVYVLCACACVVRLCMCCALVYAMLCAVLTTVVHQVPLHGKTQKGHEGLCDDWEGRP
jgi:hypothetical protein